MSWISTGRTGRLARRLASVRYSLDTAGPYLAAHLGRIDAPIGNHPHALQDGEVVMFDRRDLC